MERLLLTAALKIFLKDFTMMRALWAGVTGLQAHQIAMDVEGDNIANVNTVGFKYSRANFADLFSQTAKVATAPQGDLGGKNAMQIGLGTQINTTTRLFKQGSIQSTDKNTDLALQGDGFFVVSPDGGRTNYYTRNGDFTRDSLGNFVDNNGYIVQGWLRDENTGAIDATGPVKSIFIEPGLATPARATTEIGIIGTLNSGSNIGTKSSPIYQLDSKHGWLDKNGNGLREDGEDKDENDTNKNVYFVDKDKQVKVQEVGVDLGVLFNGQGQAFNLRNGQGMWVSYADAKASFGALPAVPGQPAGTPNTLHIKLNGIEIPSTQVSTIQDVAKTINALTTQTGVQATIINGNELQLVNTNNTGTTAAFKNIKVEKMEGDNTSMQTTSVITAYQYTYSSVAAGTTNEYDDGTARMVHSTEDLRLAMQTDARNYVNYTGENVSATTNQIQAVLNAITAAANANDALTALNGIATNAQIGTIAGLPLSAQSILAEMQTALDDAVNPAGGGAAITTTAEALGVIRGLLTPERLAKVAADEWRSPIDIDAQNGLQLATLEADGHHSNATIQERNRNDGVELIVNEKGQFVISNVGGDAAYSDGDGYTLTAAITIGAAGEEIPKGTVFPNVAPGGTFDVPEGLTVTYYDDAGALQTFVSTNGNTQITGAATSITVTATAVATAGTIPVGTYLPDTDDARTLVGGGVNSPVNKDTFTNDYNMQISVTALSDPTQNINTNTAFSEVFSALGGGLSTGTTTRTSAALTMSSHATTTEIYDSLGSKHTIKFEFRKTGYSPENGTEWSVLIQVPEPGVINTETGEQANVIAGSVRFGPNGALIGYTPSNLTYTANNGSAAGQPIEINFGTIGESDGLRSNDNTSSTDNITQDGYAAGTLNGLRVDETGTIIGAFTNGRSFGLAQVAIAKFTNNQGLESNGGNLFMRTANSGDPVIGAAQTAGRGKVSASSLEMSNVDLSRALTQLIVVQRGYQANSKTISTGDQILTTLMQIKQ